VTRREQKEAFMSTHRIRLAGGTLSLLLVGAGAACGGAAVPPKAPAATSASREASTPATPRASQSLGQGSARPSSPAGGASANGSAGADREGAGEEDVELVVSRDVVGRCPTLRLVREHVSEFDPDLVWLAVLESIADCMSQGSPLGDQLIAVSGDEEHRHVVREVLGSRGIAPTRVVARPGALGAAECQGGTICNKRVEITIAGH
jgi:hypothetical protein